MKKLLMLAVLILLLAKIDAHAQNRESVSAAEVNGTFRSYFGGKLKGNYSEIKILALGKGKLRVAFELTYPYFDADGALSAHSGSASGTAQIVGDTAIYSSDEYGPCRITIEFIKPGTIKVAQSGGDAECGFGHNVSADGTYKKSNRAKPKF